MTKYRDFSPGDPAPADWPDALSEFLGSSTHNFLLRIKPGDATKLQVPAGADNDQVAIAINGRWRYITAAVERASLGGIARSMDVFVTGSDNVFAPSGDGEVDSTVYAFGLAIVESAASPVGVALSRKVGTAAWSGTVFTSVDVIVGAQAGAARHAATHAVGGSDPVTPAAIGAATAADLAIEVARAEAAETANAAAIASEASTRAAAITSEVSARNATIAVETARAEAAEPTAGELAALAGTSGSPGSGNKYVTDGDARNTNARTPTAHAASHLTGGSDSVVGAWGSITPHAGISVQAGDEPFARLEMGDVVRLKGSLKNTLGTTLTAGQTLGTLPAGCWPTVARTVKMIAVNPVILMSVTIGLDGTMTVFSVTTVIANNAFMSLQDVSFPL